MAFVIVVIFNRFLLLTSIVLCKSMFYKWVQSMFYKWVQSMFYKWVQSMFYKWVQSRFYKWVQSMFYKWVQSMFYKSSPVQVLQHAVKNSFRNAHWPIREAKQFFHTWEKAFRPIIWSNQMTEQRVTSKFSHDRHCLLISVKFNIVFLFSAFYWVFIAGIIIWTVLQRRMMDLLMFPLKGVH